MNHSSSPLDLKANIAKARKLLDSGDFESAKALGEALVAQFPDEPNSAFVLALSEQKLGHHQKALDLFANLTQKTPNFGVAFVHLSECLQAVGQPAAAKEQLKLALNLLPNFSDGWRRLAELCLALGDQAGWQSAMKSYAANAGQAPDLIEAVNAFHAQDMVKAERLCRQHLGAHPRDVSAIRLLAEVAIQRGIYDDAQQLLERALSIAPDFHLARLNYAHTLAKRERCSAALEQLSVIEKHQPDLPALHIEKAAVLTKLGRFDEAIALYQQLITRMPRVVKLYNSLGHALKTIGNRTEAENAYHRATSMQPENGEAWWSLADLKNYRFSADNISRLEDLCAQTLAPIDAAQIHFALGKALEDAGRTEESFDHYQLGNTLKKSLEPWSIESNTRATDQMIQATPASLFAYSGGCPSPDPIFIVGLPRSGSTLLEQILSSHSEVEGTKELPDITALVRQLSGKKNRADASHYPANLSTLGDEQLRALGQEYLQRTQAQRSGKPFFIDKMPNNFAHIGLIKKILPQAKIIDARRHPMASCFSSFKQHFAHGQTFSYELQSLGHYYADYQRLMDHWHKVLPGQLLTVHYEAVVSDFENQVRKLLAHCHLPFEESCLRFYNNDRAVRTASSEQVRQPIYQSGLQAWKPFEHHLAPLKKALGDCLSSYPYP